MNTKDLKDLQLRAEHGEASTQLELGKMYYEGKGVPRHYEKARNLYFLESAKQDVMEAQFYLSVMYYEGKGGLKNPVQADYWLSKAVDAGFADAQLYLGKMREKQKKCIDAYKWFSLAAAQGNKEAIENLERLEKEMPSEDIAKAQNQSAEWHEKHQK